MHGLFLQLLVKVDRQPLHLKEKLDILNDRLMFGRLGVCLFKSNKIPKRVTSGTKFHNRMFEPIFGAIIKGWGDLSKNSDRLIG